MLARMTVLAAALAAGACTTIFPEPPPFKPEFAADRADAFAVVVVDGMRVNGGETYTFRFQRVDLQKSVFLPETFSVSFDGVGAISGNEFDKPEDLDTSIRFGGASAPAGDYALVARHDVIGSRRTHNCYTLGSTVVRLVPGNVNVMPMGSVRDNVTIYPAVAEKQTRAVLAGYPLISAPITVSRGVASIRFDVDPKKSLGCQALPTFTFTPGGEPRS